MLSLSSCPACRALLPPTPCANETCAKCGQIIAWRPNPGPQTDFLHRTAFEVMYGGAAGGGKSDALLIDAIRYVGRGHGSRYHAILFRRTFPELERTLIKRAYDLYPRLGARYDQTKKVWKFPGGELVEFGHIEHEQDVEKHLGGEYQFVGFDELTTFTESQYLRLLGRCRSGIGITCRVRSATNPGSSGHEWVFKRWGVWLDPESTEKAKPGETLYFVRGDDEIDRVVPKGTRLSKGRTFIPATLEDNPFLFNDGNYEAALQNLDLVTREQQRRGNWLIKPGKGLYFKRAWFKFVDRDQVPSGVRRVRYWDRAATEPEKGKDPDWTVGLKAAWADDGRFFVEDVARMRGSPGEVEQYIEATAEADGDEVSIWLEQEPGASGKAEIASYIKRLSRWTVHPDRKRLDKVVAAGPVSSQTEQGNVYLVRAPWNEQFIQEGEQFPEGSHDDQIDALSGAYSKLHRRPRPKGGEGAVSPAIAVEDIPVGY